MSTRSRRAVARTTLTTAPSGIIVPDRDLVGAVRVLTCGSVDDGKSTLIGRLLWDASDLFDDQREALRRNPRRVVDGRHLDYSLLVDGLMAEREQGITIDIAWRYFDTAHRRFVIIDSPGHPQYTRNMASGATHADVAVMLIDARHGIKSQTRRHAALLDLFGVRRVILAVNKMDLVEWSEARFREIEQAFQALTLRFRFEAVLAIPVAAVSGDNVAVSSTAMAWYRGPTLLDALNRSAPRMASEPRPNHAFRLPVQAVIRDGQDFRGIAGTVVSGDVAVGAEVIDVISGQTATVARIATMDGDLASAATGRAVALVLDRDIDIARGAVLAMAKTAPILAHRIDVRMVWMSETPFDPEARYHLRTSTDSVPVASLMISDLLDLETLARAKAFACSVNDIASATFELARATALDTFATSPKTGAFVLVDAITGATVAGGVVIHASTTQARPVVGASLPVAAFRLTRAMLTEGVCADLPMNASSEVEFRRRAVAVRDVLRSAGVVVSSDFDTNLQ